MTTRVHSRTDWLVENSFTILALGATIMGLGVTAVHVAGMSKEVWERPNVAALEVFQIADQILSFIVLGTVLALGLRGSLGIGLRFFCAFMSAASAYAEMFVMSAEHVSGREEFWGPFTIIMSMGSASLLEALSGIMDSLEPPVERR